MEPIKIDSFLPEVITYIKDNSSRFGNSIEGDEIEILLKQFGKEDISQLLVNSSSVEDEEIGLDTFKTIKKEVTNVDNSDNVHEELNQNISEDNLNSYNETQEVEKQNFFENPEVGSDFLREYNLNTHTGYDIYANAYSDIEKFLQQGGQVEFILSTIDDMSELNSKYLNEASAQNVIQDNNHKETRLPNGKTFKYTQNIGVITNNATKLEDSIENEDVEDSDSSLDDDTETDSAKNIYGSGLAISTGILVEDPKKDKISTTLFQTEVFFDKLNFKGFHAGSKNYKNGAKGHTTVVLDAGIDHDYGNNFTLGAGYDLQKNKVSFGGSLRYKRGTESDEKVRENETKIYAKYDNNINEKNKWGINLEANGLNTVYFNNIDALATLYGVKESDYNKFVGMLRVGGGRIKFDEKINLPNNKIDYATVESIGGFSCKPTDDFKISGSGKISYSVSKGSFDNPDSSKYIQSLEGGASIALEYDKFKFLGIVDSKYPLSVPEQNPYVVAAVALGYQITPSAELTAAYTYGDVGLPPEQTVTLGVNVNF